MRYLSKGELLTMLGSDSNAFTAFMLDPASFGVTGQGLIDLKVAKQKLDWTDTIDIDMPEVQNMLLMLQSLSVISPANLAKINSISDRQASELFIVTVKALADITLQNQYGAKQNGQYWTVDFEFKNNTTGLVIIHTENFSESPTTDILNSFVEMKLLELRQQ